MTQRSRTPGPRAVQATIPEDRLSMIWAVVVPVIFALILVLALIGVPSRLFPEPTPEPFPTPLGSGSFSVTPSVSGNPSSSPATSGSGPASAAPSVQTSPTP